MRRDPRRAFATYCIELARTLVRGPNAAARLVRRTRQISESSLVTAVGFIDAKYIVRPSAVTTGRSRARPARHFALRERRAWRRAFTREGAPASADDRVATDGASEPFVERDLATWWPPSPPCCLAGQVSPNTRLSVAAMNSQKLN